MTPWVLRLIVANVVIFVLTSASPQVGYYLAFVPAGVLARPWTIVSYMFVHANVMHILLNMLALYFFGPRLEDRLGSGNFLALYFLSGIAGAFLTFAVFFGGVLFPGALPGVLGQNPIVVGASGAVMGVTAAYARYWPWDRIYIWGILPVTAWVMVIGLAAYSIWSGLMGSRGGVADFAHLGGLAAGWLYGVAYDRHRRNAWPPTRKQPRLSGGEGRARVERWQRIRPEELHELNRGEVERLLAKVREQGPGSLTLAERELLDRFAPP